MSRTPDPDAELTARKQAAGKFGFTLGCIAALIAAAMNLYRTPKPLTPLTAVILLLMAALNIPLGIAIGLIWERMTRNDANGPPGPRK
jgi:hypothetical protein